MLITILIAYLLGSIPTAVWWGKRFYNADVRNFGSGNAGATNVFRVLGKKAGIPVLLIDIAKGFVAVNLILFTSINSSSVWFVCFQIVLGLTAIMGHIFPIFAGFKGGKGVATVYGVIITLSPIASIGASVIFLLSLIITKYVSLSSMLAAISLPIFIYYTSSHLDLYLFLFVLAITLLIIVTHKKNIKRLIEKSESKTYLFGNKK